MPSSATRSRPIHPRRVSGPVRGPALAGPQVRGRTSAFEKIARIPDNRFVDRVLRSRGCILLIGLLLGGIVTMQVSLLRLNTGISRAWQTQETLAHQNQSLQALIAERTSAAAVREKAANMNLVDPAAGDTRFLTTRGEKDAVRAAKRMQPPGELQQMVMANNGLMPGEGATLASILAAEDGLATTNSAVTTPEGTAPATAAQATPTPVAATSTPEALPTPVPTATPIPTAVPTVDPATGLSTAPQG